jgi:hypothetical protein
VQTKLLLQKQKAGHDGKYLIGLLNAAILCKSLTNRATRKFKSSWTRAEKK